MAIGFWRTSSSRTKRIMTIIAFFLLATFVTVVGVLTPLTSQDAQSLNNQLEQLRASASVQYIFGNNFMISLIMFIPIVGPIFGLWALYNTGVVIAAEGIVQGVPPLLVFSSLLILPIFWLEFISYSTALAESAWLIKRAAQGLIRREIRNAAILVAFVGVVLLVSAVIEIVLINYFG
jgi:hypothetical protein